MARQRIGKLPPRYGFMLNPFSEMRLSSCPKCDKLTYPRKFALLIHVEGWGPFVFGKTCKYCSRCELIMAHQDELEWELANTFERLAPDVVGNEYFVVGSVERKTWKAGLAGDAPQSLDEALQHTADFKRYHDLRYDPGGWRLPGQGPRHLEPKPPDTPWRAGPGHLRRKERQTFSKGGG
jgi:hypothetical protein